MTELFDLNLIVELKCLERVFSEEKKFRIGDCFNLEEDFIYKETEEILNCNLNCKSYEIYIYTDLKKLYPSEIIRKLYNGYKTFEKE